jgi:uncharacterized membrane protein
MREIVINQFKVPKNYILLLFAIIYCLISIINHYNYRTYSFDLGIYNNCLYQYGHFHKNHYPYLHYMFTNFLADHFSLYTVILSPLYYIFGTPTLLFVQILSILFGGIGVYKIVKKRFTEPFLPEIAMVHYLSFFGIYSALSFDYHDNVVSAMFVPWFLYYFDSKKIKMTILFAILIVIGKENMPIWLAAICLGLLFLNYKEKTKRNLAIVLMFASIIYFIVILKIVMPSMDHLMAERGYNAFQYNVLGGNLNEITSNLINQPQTIFKALFFNHLENTPELEHVKSELYICLLLSGGWMLLFRPQYLIMLVPIIAQKVFSDDFGKWGINAHYSIEFTPIVIIGFYDGLKYVNNKKAKIALAVFACFFTIKTTYDKMETREAPYYNKTNGCFYIKEHYKYEFHKDEVKQAMSLIPEDANLSSLNVFAAHLSFRKNIYQFPDVHDAEYVLLASTPNSYPIRGAELEVKIKEYKNSEDWETLYDSKGIYLFKKHIKQN